MKINVKIRDEELNALLNNLGKNAKNTESVMKDLSVYMKQQVMENFKAEGRPEQWRPLSEKYLKYKLQKKGASKLLEFHGKLKQSINARSSKGEARVRTGVKYGVYHQTGTKKMPARPFMPSSDVPDMPPFDDKGMQYMKRKLQEAIMNV